MWESVSWLIFSLNRALKEMCLVNEKAHMLRNLPKFRSVERNVRSIIGRLLNPDMQKMANMIHDMPRVLRVYNRARGIAMSHDRFQFIFDSQIDLQMVLDARAWSSDVGVWF